MVQFELHPQLAKDCITLGKLNSSLLLLLNNSLLPWFILVPLTSEIEVIDLPLSEQRVLQEEINLVASFIREHFEISKLNIATIGNIVSQLHIHVVGRKPTDFCWPNVVWGNTQREPYSEMRVTEIDTALRHFCGNKFV